MNKNVKRFDKLRSNVNNPNAAEAWKSVFSKLALLGAGISITSYLLGFGICVFQDRSYRKQQFKTVAKNG